MLKIKKIKPMFTSLVTTMDVYEEVKTAGGIIDATKSGGIKEYQTVVAVGPSVRGIKEGDVVCINPSRYAQRKHQEGTLKDGIITDNPVTKYNFNVIEMNDIPYLLLQDNDIEFVIEDYEEVEEAPPEVKSDIYIPKSKIIC